MKTQSEEVSPEVIVTKVICLHHLVVMYVHGIHKISGVGTSRRAETSQFGQLII